MQHTTDRIVLTTALVISVKYHCTTSGYSTNVMSSSSLYLNYESQVDVSIDKGRSYASINFSSNYYKKKARSILTGNEMQSNKD